MLKKSIVSLALATACFGAFAAGSASVQTAASKPLSYELMPNLTSDEKSTYIGGEVAWSVISGQLPAGLALVGDKITGTPSVAGVAEVVVRARYKPAYGKRGYQDYSLKFDIPGATKTAANKT